MRKKYEKLIACVLVLMMGLTCAVIPVHATETETEETGDTPIEIGSADELIDFATKINNGTYSASTNAVLTTDIDVTAATTGTFAPIGTNRIPYSGTFDGQGNKVNLNISSTYGEYVGLFGYISGATIKNVGVTGSISAYMYVGGIAGYVYGGTIENCWNEGAVTGMYHVGGIAGEVAGNGRIEKCWNKGTVTGRGTEVENAGGIAGYIYEGTIENCWNGGAVTGAYSVGGIAGYAYTATVKNCYNSGTISSSCDSGGGIAGYNEGTISNCYYLNTSSDSDGGGTSKDAGAFQSGEVAWLLNGESSEGVWKMVLGTDGYPGFTGDTVYKWTDGTYSNQQYQAPAPEFTTSQTASSIRVTLSDYNSGYGIVQYSRDGTTWQNFASADNCVITGLGAGTSYTIYVRYAGTADYATSAPATKAVTTDTASYTISIPSAPLTAGGSDSNTISASLTSSFDLGYNGKVLVTVKGDGSVSSDGRLTLTRDENTRITSNLLVNDTAFTDIANPVATFTTENYTQNQVKISFAAPTSTTEIIPAGDYTGTITFVVSYCEE